MLLIAVVAVAVILFLGIKLIDSGNQELDNETLVSPEYNSTATMVNTLFTGAIGIPAALGVIAMLVVFAWLMRVV
jgi:hypothetical protein